MLFRSRIFLGIYHAASQCSHLTLDGHSREEKPAKKKKNRKAEKEPDDEYEDEYDDEYDEYDDSEIEEDEKADPLKGDTRNFKRPRRGRKNPEYDVDFVDL